MGSYLMKILIRMSLPVTAMLAMISKMEVKIAENKWLQ